MCSRKDSDLNTYDSAKSVADAHRIVDAIIAKGGRPAVGFMAVPVTWAARFGRTTDDLFDGCTNISIATAMLSEYEHACSLKPDHPSALPDADLPSRVLTISAALFSVPIDRLHQRLRHRDVTSARYVAAWLLSRRHWASTKIGSHLGLDHSTVLHGIRRVETTDHLRTIACKAELLLGLG